MDAARRARLLRQYLATDVLLGVDVVPRGVISQPATAQAGAAGGTVAPESPGAATFGPQAHDAKAAAAAAASPATPSRQVRAGAAGSSAPPSSVAGSPVATPTSSPIAAPPSAMTRQQKAEILDRIEREEVRQCTRCELCRSRTQTVFADGDPDARLMFIGEGPGQNEDEQGLPFVGRAGELLNKMIDAMGLSRQTVYIANVVKCRPPNNRPPTPKEAATCWDYLRRQILTVQPAVIVTLGGPAADRLLAIHRGITAVRGTWHTFHGLEPEGPPIPVMPTFHPAYLLRNYNRETRAKVWSDLQQVMQLLQSEGA